MEKWNFKDKIYIVTGASSGIGQSCAKALLKEGALVAGIDVQPASIEDAKYTHYAAGVTEEEKIEDIVEDIKNKFGRIDGLVNAAGIWGNSKPFYETETKNWEKIISVNLIGMYIVSKYVSRVMIMQKSGKIVNIACIRSSIFRNNMTDYAASKGGVVSLTAAMALDLAPYNINVNSVAPGFTYTGMTRKSFDDENVRIQSEALIPNGRLAEAQDISDVVMFLLSDMSDYVNGANLYADGGYHIQK